MLWQLVQRYSLKLVFALALLSGLQLPHFLQQYEHRLDAHYQEAQAQLLQYQLLADLYFAGDIDALISEHQQSEVVLFHKEAAIIAQLVARVDLLQLKKQALQGHLVNRLYYLIRQINTPLWRETQENYQAEIVLNRDAVVVGLLCALAASLFLECLFMLLAYQCRRLRHRVCAQQQTGSGKNN